MHDDQNNYVSTKFNHERSYVCELEEGATPWYLKNELLLPQLVPGVGLALLNVARFTHHSRRAPPAQDDQEDDGFSAHTP